MIQPKKLLLLSRIPFFGMIKTLLKKAWLSTSPANPADIRCAGLKLRIHPWNMVVKQKILFGRLETCGYRMHLQKRSNTVLELSPVGIPL